MTQVQCLPYARETGRHGIDQAKLDECIQACFECAQTCTSCADARLDEVMVAELTRCIRTSLDCLDLCVATEKILARHVGHPADIAREVLGWCRTACLACADECGQQAARQRHCESCTEACLRCELACTELLASLDM